MKNVQLLILWLAGIIFTVVSFTAYDLPTFQNPALARIVFWHLPCAIAAVLFLFTGSWFAYRWLRTHDLAWDARANAANELAFLLGGLTLATGILFSKVQWGAWWNWDPRQTSFLLAMAIIAAYFALRGAVEDRDRRATVSAAYSMAALLPLLFLVFIFPRLKSVLSLHPRVVDGGGFDRTYGTIILGMIVVLTAFAFLAYRQRVRLTLLEMESENLDAELANRNRAAPPRVVRSVPLPTEGGDPT